MNNLIAYAEQLSLLWKSLQTAWQTTQTHWHDPVQQSFDREIMQPLQSQTEITYRELVRLAEVIAEAKRHVE